MLCIILVLIELVSGSYVTILATVAAVEIHLKGQIIMKTIDDIMGLMTDKSVISDLADLLRANDAQFAQSEKKFIRAVETLRGELPEEQAPALNDYLAACESDIFSSVTYAGYLGFKVNLENYHHPVGIDFVHLDTIDYIKGHLFGHFPINYRNAQIRDRFIKSLPAAFEQLHNDIRDYYTHLECAGPKLAHYAGYIIGNHLLPWVEPGYRADEIQTTAFAAETKKYIGFLPL